MLHRDQAGTLRQMLQAADLAVEADDRARQGQHAARPKAAKPHHGPARGEQERQAEDSEQRGAAKERNVKEERAQPAHRA